MLSGGGPRQAGAASFNMVPSLDVMPAGGTVPAYGSGHLGRGSKPGGKGGDLLVRQGTWAMATAWLPRTGVPRTKLALAGSPPLPAGICQVCCGGGGTMADTAALVVASAVCFGAGGSGGIRFSMIFSCRFSSAGGCGGCRGGGGGGGGTLVLPLLCESTFATSTEAGAGGTGIGGGGREKAARSRLAARATSSPPSSLPPDSQ